MLVYPVPEVVNHGVSLVLDLGRIRIPFVYLRGQLRFKESIVYRIVNRKEQYKAAAGVNSERKESFDWDGHQACRVEERNSCDVLAMSLFMLFFPPLHVYLCLLIY